MQSVLLAKDARGDNYVARCVNCAEHKCTPTGLALMLLYPTPEQLWDLVSVDLLQQRKSQYGSQYLLVCIDHFSHFVVFAPVKNKTAASVSHALVTQLFCHYSTPRVLLIDNGAKFRSAILSEIYSQYSIKQTLTVVYHSESNELAETASRKILASLRPLVNCLQDNWEDCVPQVTACINSSINESTGKSPHYILYGVDKRLLS